MKQLLIFTAIVGLTAPAAFGQSEAQAAFTSENAILDTSLPFAIGAREAQQNIRGSFGWATFQEGLAEGVYFRFDPDGYARFSPSPRLDTDVFEVICRPRTYSCMGRKNALSLMLNDRGQMQIKIEGIGQGDLVFVSDGTQDLQLPARILQPLDIHLESLLSTGGDLVVRRGQDELAKVSLRGFSAVAAYLRWITARQDYTVLPRNWPVPNSKTAASTGAITQASNWNSPMPQPQAIPSLGAPLQQATGVGSDPAMDQVRSELALLKDLLAARQNQASTVVEAQTEPVQPVPAAPQAQSGNDDRIAQLENTTQRLLEELILLRQAQTLPPAAVPNAPDVMQVEVMHDAPLPVPAMTPDPVMAEQAPMPAEALPNEVAHLQYLVAEMGLDPKTALVLMQFIQPENMEMMPETPALQRRYHDTLAQTILDDLERELKGEMPIEPAAITPAPPDDVVLEPLPSMAGGGEGSEGSFSDENKKTTEPPADGSTGTEPASEGAVVAETDTEPANPLAAKLSEEEFQPLSSYFRSVLELK